MNYAPVFNDEHNTFWIYLGETIMVPVLSTESPPPHAYDGSYRVVAIEPTRFSDLEKNTPLEVVEDSWYFSGDFPGTHLDYKSNMFYSNDFLAEVEGN